MAIRRALVTGPLDTLLRAPGRAGEHETDHLDGRRYLDVRRGETRRRALPAIRTADRAVPAR